MDKDKLKQIASQLTSAFYAGSERKADLTPQQILETYQEFFEKLEKWEKENRKPGKLHTN